MREKTTDRSRFDRATATALVSMALLASSCAEKPAAPTFDNIFDQGTDQLNTRLAFADGNVIVTWDHLLAEELGEEVASYTVFRSDRPDGGFFPVSTLTESTTEEGDDDEAGTRVVRDPEYLPDRLNYYGIGFLTELDREASALGVPLVTITPPPRVRFLSGGFTTPTRQVKLLAQSAANIQAHVSSDPTFADFTVVEPLEDSGGGFNQKQFDWDLGPANANGDTIVVFVRVPRIEGGFSPTGSLDVEVQFEPQLQVLQFDPELEEYGTSIFKTSVHLEVPTTGVERMRFATSVEGLGAAEWLIPSVTASPDTLDFELSAATSTPEVWAAYEGDFGFTTLVTTSVTPPSAGPATLTIDGDAPFTTDPDRMVTVVSDVQSATLMRIAESPDFAGVAWVAFQDTVEFQLSAPPGPKTLYGWYTNPFDPAGIVTTDEIILVGEGP